MRYYKNIFLKYVRDAKNVKSRAWLQGWSSRQGWTESCQKPGPVGSAPRWSQVCLKPVPKPAGAPPEGQRQRAQALAAAAAAAADTAPLVWKFVKPGPFTLQDGTSPPQEAGQALGAWQRATVDTQAEKWVRNPGSPQACV